MNPVIQRKPRLSLTLWAVTGLLAISPLAKAEEVLVYKVSSSRNWQQNTEVNPGQATASGRRQVAGVARDTSYLILNRTTNEVVRIDYYTRTSDGARLKEFAVFEESAADWTGVFPAAEWEALQVAAVGGKVSLSLKSGYQRFFTDDDNRDGETDSFDEGFLSFFVGTGAPRRFGITTLPNVAASLQGVKRQNILAEYGPALDIIGNKFPLARVYYRGSGAQRAVLDSRTTNSVLNVAPPVGSGQTIATTDYAVFLVKALLDKAGFEDAAAGVLN
jgi:hypothetical protein